MSLKYRDFVPRQIVAPGLLKHGEYESFEAAVTAFNDWLIASKVRLIQVETVVLPNIHSRWEEGTGDASLGIGGDTPSLWHQFLRCWYDE